MAERAADGWVRSSRCESKLCVEAKLLPSGVVVRDGKDPDGAVLSFGGDVWRRFCAGLRAGR